MTVEEVATRLLDFDQAVYGSSCSAANCSSPNGTRVVGTLSISLEPNDVSAKLQEAVLATVQPKVRVQCPQTSCNMALSVTEHLICFPPFCAIGFTRPLVVSEIPDSDENSQRVLQNPAAYERKYDIKLSQVPAMLKVFDGDYHLRGIIAYKDPCHFVAYGRRRDGYWYVMDDLKDCARHCSDNTEVTMRMAFYTK